MTTITICRPDGHSSTVYFLPADSAVLRHHPVNCPRRLLFLGWRATRKKAAGGNPMPYQSNTDLPSSVRDHLPAHAQAIYREAFNHAWDEYKDSDKRRSQESREEVAHKVAWSAVKEKYEKSDTGGQWKRSNER
jgi:cation transport regulator